MKTRILLALMVSMAALIVSISWTRISVGTAPVFDSVAAWAPVVAPALEDLSTPGGSSQENRRRAGTPIVPEWIHERADAAPVTTRHISGTVTSFPDGRAIDDAIVAIVGPFSGNELATTRTDTNGRYELDTNGDGVQISSDATGYLEWTRIVDLGPKDLVMDILLVPKPPTVDPLIHLRAPDGRPFLETLEADDRHIAASLRPVFVVERVDRGTCISGTSVFSARAKAVGTAGTDAWYSASLGAGAEGTCCLVIGDRVIDVAPFDVRTRDIVLVASKADLQAAQGSLRIEVVDEANGQPFSGAFVRVLPQGGSELRAVANDQGVVTVEHVTEGRAQVIISSCDHARAGETSYVSGADEPRESEVRRECLVHGEQQTDLGSIMLRRTVTISGWVIWPPDTSSMPTVTLSKPVDPPPANDTFRLFSEVGEGPVTVEGAFLFSGLLPGRYTVRVDRRPRDPTGGPDVYSFMGVPMASIDVDAQWGDVNGVRLELPSPPWLLIKPRPALHNGVPWK